MHGPSQSLQRQHPNSLSYSLSESKAEHILSVGKPLYLGLLAHPSIPSSVWF